MAPARGTPSSAGLGDLNLDTSDGGLANLNLDTSDGGLTDLTLDTSGGGRGETPTGELAGETDGGLADPWARFTEQLGWDELRVNQAVGALEPALPAAAEGMIAPRAPTEPAAAFPAATAPDSAPVPADFPAYGAGPAAITSAEPVASREIDLPTEPLRHDRSATGSREQWRARARELGLYSVFVVAPDDFGNLAPTAAPPPAAPQLQTPTHPEPAAALHPVVAEAAALSSVPAEAAARFPVVAGSSSPDSAPGAPSAAAVPTVASSPAAGSEQAAVAAPAPSSPATSSRLLGAARQGGSLLRSIQRPTATPLAKELVVPVVPVVTEPATSPLPSATAVPQVGSLLVTEVAQVVGQSLRRGKSLLRQLLRGSVAAPASKDPPAR